MATINVAPRGRVSGPELFPELVAGHITCRVCGREDDVQIDHPALLCHACLKHPAGTHARVQDWLSSVLRQLDQAQAEWQEMIDFSPAKDRWQSVAVALAKVGDKELDRATFARAWATRKAEGGALADLLTAYERYCAETDRLGAELERLGRAQTEINHVWMETEL